MSPTRSSVGTASTTLLMAYSATAYASLLLWLSLGRQDRFMVARLALPGSSSQLARRFSCGPPDADTASHDQFQDLHGAPGVGPHNGISLEQLYVSFFGAVGLVACQGIVAQGFLHP